jgi:Reverse transcriptase (RNA-dependent DNA polymerase)
LFDIAENRLSNPLGVICFNHTFLVDLSGVPQGSHLGPLCFIWFMSDISLILKYFRVLVYAYDMKLFLPVSSSQDSLKIQSDLDRLARWCDENALPLTVGKCKIMSFTRFTYTIGSSTLERVVSITELGVILDSKLSFRNHIDTKIAKGLAMLGFMKRLSSDFRDPYTLKTLHSKLVYACCVWQPFYAVHIARIERIQEKFVEYAYRLIEVVAR